MRVLRIGTALALLLMFIPHAGQAQCCGDCDGSGQVTIDEVLTAVNNSLNNCSAPTPTPTPSTCLLDFRSNNVQTMENCLYQGPFNTSCGGPLLSSFFSNGGSMIVVQVLELHVFFGAAVVSNTLATLQGWFTHTDASDFTPLSGSITLTDNGRTLTVAPSASPFSIANCGFAKSVGAYFFLQQASASGANGGAAVGFEASAENRDSMEALLQALKQQSGD